ncbi:gag [Rhesus macaque simian foamy virus]|uniref:Gag polyprotein n=1 Tax=Rhesus macaque simian foamy virus TaxID=2170199 RepID=A0A218MNI7_9RETR|nr:gag [Rhesus macaque simian foamy virus]ASF20093.1 gag [Rhesus macaque simian foamy virus]
MAAVEGDLDVQALTDLFNNLGINRDPRHREVIALRMTGGWWGPATRYNLITVLLQDDQGQPLQQPRWRAEGRAANPAVMLTLEAPWQDLRMAFDNVDLADDTLRFGPLANGNYIPGDEYSLEFIPPAMQEIAQMQRDELENVLDIVGQITMQMSDLIGMQDAQIRGLEGQIRGLRGNLPVAGTPPPPPPSLDLQPAAASSPYVAPASSAPAAPVASADLGWFAGGPSPGSVDPRLARVAYNPFLPGPSDGSGVAPVQPSAPPAASPLLPLPPAQPVQPVIQYVHPPPMNPAQQIIPIQHIRAVTGNAPTNPREIPMWIGRNASAIEGVFPMTTPDLRCRVINALLGGNLGLNLEPQHCVTWASAIATLYVRTHGSYPIHQLAEVLRGVANSEGVAAAYQLGMMLTNRDYNLIWGIIRPLLPGQAVVTAMQHRLDQEINDAARVASFINHLNGVYELLGLNARGQSLRIPASGGQTTAGTSAGRGTRGRRSQQGTPGRQSSGQSQQQGRRSSQGQSRQSDSSDQNVQRQSQGGNGRGGYNLRPRTYQPQRYGGGRGRRWNDQPARSDNQQRSQSQQPQSEARGEQSRTSGAGRGQGGRGNQNRNQRSAGGNADRTVNTVTTASASTSASGQDGSSPAPPASGSGNQGN